MSKVWVCYTAGEYGDDRIGLVTTGREKAVAWVDSYLANVERAHIARPNKAEWVEDRYVGYRGLQTNVIAEPCEVEQ